MELLYAIIVAALGGLFLYKRKADSAAVENKLIETKAKDQALQEQQKEVEAAIQTLDAGIEKMRAEREAQRKKDAEDNLSLKQRADRIKRGID